MNSENLNCRGEETAVCPATCNTIALVCPPEQPWDRLYTPDDGLAMGTLFESLNLPFIGCEGRKQ